MIAFVASNQNCGFSVQLNVEGGDRPPSAVPLLTIDGFLEAAGVNLSINYLLFDNYPVLMK